MGISMYMGMGPLVVKRWCGYGYVGFWSSVGMGILWGYPQDFLWVWDGCGDRNSVPTAALHFCASAHAVDLPSVL